MSSSTAQGKVCAGEGCVKPARQQCPTCLKIAAPDVLESSYFCSQECFKANWATHKLHHRRNEGPVQDIFPGFQYSGELRAWSYGPEKTVPPEIQRPDYALTGIPRSEQIDRNTRKVHCLNPEQAEKMRTVCRIGREVLDIAAAAVRPGVTTDELDRIVHEETIKRNSYPAPLNYKFFPRSCCTSVNEIICHGVPDLRPLKDGDIVNIDVSVYYDGFFADLNETYPVGNVDEKSRRLIDTTRECVEKAIQACKPGQQYRELGEIIEKHARANGFSVVRAYCGHGINQYFHSLPDILHYAKNKAVGTMKPGHCFTIEPMINEGSPNELLWPDEWTSATVDGKRSAQFEHTVLITETGCVVLTARRA